MKLISYDVGIRNMAYCVFEYDEQGLRVTDWNVLNLMAQQDNALYTCGFAIPHKKKNLEIPLKICGKKACLEKNGDYFCMTHGKSLVNSKNYLLPNTLKIPILRKLSLDELKNLGNDHHINNIHLVKTKKHALELFTIHIQENSFHTVSKKKKNAGEEDLIVLGRSLKQQLCELTGHDDLTHVIIENQISPIATRMKTLQGMLAQYYIMKNESLTIEFISSSNKLKHLVKHGGETLGDNANQYKQHKSDAIFYGKKIFQENPNLGNWDSIFSHKKVDDLADCFLQGLYYLENRKLITYAENLKINSINLS